MTLRHFAATVTCVSVLAVAGCSSSKPASGSSDTGVQACTMMRADKQAGTTPDDTRSNQEIDLLKRSGNADLRKAGAALASSDTSTQMGAVGSLYTGCASVGVPVS